MESVIGNSENYPFSIRPFEDLMTQKKVHDPDTKLWNLAMIWRTEINEIKKKKKKIQYGLNSAKTFDWTLFAQFWPNQMNFSDFPHSVFKNS